jgi:anti-sigma factor RsiW
MFCSKVKDLLTTDYLDGRLQEAQAEEVRAHLAHCPSCAKLEKELQAQRLLFQQVIPEQPPQQVWENIRETIIAERLVREGRGSLLERLKDRLWQPRPALALASAFAVILMVIIFAGNFISKKAPLPAADNTELLATYDLNGDSISGFGTSIEEYFL